RSSDLPADPAPHLPTPVSLVSGCSRLAICRSECRLAATGPKNPCPLLGGNPDGALPMITSPTAERVSWAVGSAGAEEEPAGAGTGGCAEPTAAGAGVGGASWLLQAASPSSPARSAAAREASRPRATVMSARSCVVEGCPSRPYPRRPPAGGAPANHSRLPLPASAGKRPSRQRVSAGWAPSCGFGVPKLTWRGDAQ